jgi:hypothetical protein
MPGGTTSNIFTYFSKGNLALSVLMTVTSTVFGVLLIPIVLLIYATALDLEIPRENIIATLVILLVPVAIGMGLRKLNANVGAVTEFMGSALALFFIAFIAISWVPRNWQFLLTTTPATYFAAIMLGVFGIAIGYGFARILRLHPRNARTVALETGIQNGPLAIAIIALTFAGDEAAKHHRRGRALLALHRDDLDARHPDLPPRQHRRRAEDARQPALTPPPSSFRKYARAEGTAAPRGSMPRGAAPPSSPRARRLVLRRCKPAKGQDRQIRQATGTCSTSNPGPGMAPSWPCR